MKNKVYLIGAGTGDPGLITVRGREILRQADIVIYDYLVDKILLSEAKPGAQLICCDELGKKRYTDKGLTQNQKVNRLLIKKAKEGKKVIRLKSGDPDIFGRTSQELAYLAKNKINFEIIPGVTAALAASAFCGIPLTDRQIASTCIFVTGHEDKMKEESSLDWQSISKSETIVFYMAAANLDKIVGRLLTSGKTKSTKIAIIRDVSLFTQKTLTGTLGDILDKAKKNKIKPPSIVIIGKTVGFEKYFNWFRKTPKILFTGISPERFFEKGKFLHLPLIKIIPLKDYREFDSKIKNIREYDWVVFSSRYGAEYFFKRLLEIGADARVLINAKIAAIGESTRRKLLDFGISADLVPKEESSVGLLRAFKKVDIMNKNIFIPRSDLSDKGLTEGLKIQGANVTASVAYKNIMPEYLPDVDFNSFKEIKFSSPSGVRNFIKRYGRLPKKIRVSCIGKVTGKEARKWKLID